MSNSDLDKPVAKPLRTILAFGALALAAHVVSSPWWEGPVLSIHPVLPEPSGAFVEAPETNETVKQQLATVDLAPTAGESSDESGSKARSEKQEPGAALQKAAGGDKDDKVEKDEKTGGEKDETERDSRTRPDYVYRAHPTNQDFDLLDNIRALDNKLDDPPTPLERPCLEYHASHLTRSYRPVCQKRALDPFFARLRAVALKEADEPVRLSQFGDSLIAGDSFTGELRRLMQKQFGAGGFGYIHVGKASRFNETRNLDTETSPGWRKYDVIHDPRADAPFGLAGVAFEVTGRPTLEITPEESGRGRRFDRVGLLYYRRYRSLDIRINVGGEGRDVDLSGRPKTNALRWVETEPGAQRVTVAGFDRSAYYYGLILERSGPGVVVDNLGMSSGRAPRLDYIDPEQWQAQIRTRGPHALAFAYGVNSVGKHKASDAWLSRYAETYTSILETARGASDEVGCLVVSLLMRGGLENDRVVVRDSVEPLIRRQHQAARRASCAFWNAHEAMGGQAGARRWYRNTPQLLGSDFAHPTRAGYKKLANLFYASLIREFRRYLDERIQRATIPRLRDPHGRDDATFSR